MIAMIIAAIKSVYKNDYVINDRIDIKAIYRMTKIVVVVFVVVIV